MRLLIAFAALLAAALIACSQAPESTGSPDAPAAETPTGAVVAPSDSTAQSGNTVEVEMTAEEFAFSPSTIRVRQGDRVIIRITGSDDEHGILIDGYGQQVKFGEGGDGATLDFVADKAGTFTFRCNVPCGSGHRTMTGQLIVEA